jgi:hypothetical protein
MLHLLSRKVFRALAYSNICARTAQSKNRAWHSRDERFSPVGIISRDIPNRGKALALLVAAL